MEKNTITFIGHFKYVIDKHKFSNWQSICVYSKTAFPSSKPYGKFTHMGFVSGEGLPLIPDLDVEFTCKVTKKGIVNISTAQAGSSLSPRIKHKSKNI